MISRKFHLTACHTTGANSLRTDLIFCYVILCIYANITFYDFILFDMIQQLIMYEQMNEHMTSLKLKLGLKLELRLEGTACSFRLIEVTY